MWSCAQEPWQCGISRNGSRPELSHTARLLPGVAGKRPCSLRSPATSMIMLIAERISVSRSASSGDTLW